MRRVAGIGGVFIKSKDPDTLRAEGCVVDERMETSEYGTFGWVMDPEGNHVELWQPPPGPMPG